MDVRVPHTLAPEQFERLKAEEKARAHGCSATAGDGTWFDERLSRPTMWNEFLPMSMPITVIADVSRAAFRRALGAVARCPINLPTADPLPLHV